MQLVLSKNRIIAHGENFLAMGGVVINTETGAKYENATIAECNGCPSDIDKVGYEYHAGVFVPCAPYGKGNNNGYFMEACESCATPRNSGIPIKGGIKLENLHPEISAFALGGANIALLWENASPRSSFDAQTVTLTSEEYTYLLIEAAANVDFVGEYSTRIVSIISPSGGFIYGAINYDINTGNLVGRETHTISRLVKPNGYTVKFGDCWRTHLSQTLGVVNSEDGVPIKIYGVKL